MTTALYLRHSLDRDGNRLAVTRQRDECLKLIATKGWADQPVTEYEDNSISATTGKTRPDYQRMLADMAAGKITRVAVWDLDRLHRQPVELETFMKLADAHGVSLATVTGECDLSTDNGRLFARIKGAVAAAEVERKSERQKAANRQRRQAGKPPAGGLRAVGYEPDGVTVREDEARHIRDGFDALVNGGSLRTIAARWNAAGFTTAHGKPWRPNSVRYVLKNWRYCGLVAHMKEEIGKGDWPAIVSEDIYRAARAILDDPSRKTVAMPPYRKTLLSGLALCHHCGEPVAANRNHLGTRTYSCEQPKRGMSRAAEPVEDFVVAVVIERLSRPDAIELIQPRTDTRVDVQALRTEAAALRVRLEELTDLFVDGRINQAQLDRGTSRADTRLAVIAAELASAGSASVLAGVVTADDVRAAWEALGVDEKRAVIETLMTITLHSPGRGARVFDPATVRVEWR